MADITNLGNMIEYRDILTEEINSKLAERDDIDSAIKEALGDDEHGYVDGREVVRYRTSPRKAVDVARLRAEDPELASKYLRTTWVRRFERVLPE